MRRSRKSTSGCTKCRTCHAKVAVAPRRLRTRQLLQSSQSAVPLTQQQLQMHQVLHLPTKVREARKDHAPSSVCRAVKVLHLSRKKPLRLHQVLRLSHRSKGGLAETTPRPAASEEQSKRCACHANAATDAPKAARATQKIGIASRRPRAWKFLQSSQSAPAVKQKQLRSCGSWGV